MTGERNTARNAVIDVYEDNTGYLLYIDHNL